MVSIRIIYPYLDEFELNRGNILCIPATVELDFRSEQPLISLEESEELIKDLKRANERLRKINTQLPINKKNASLEELKQALVCCLELDLSRSRTKRQIISWHRNGGRLALYIKGVQYTLRKSNNKWELIADKNI